MTDPRNAAAPAEDRGGLSDHVARGSVPTIPPSADIRPRPMPFVTPEDVAEALADRLAVAVVYRDREGRLRRGLRLTVATAERFAARCRDEGRPCEVVLTRLSPVSVGTLTTQARSPREVRRDDAGRLVSNEVDGRWSA